MSIKEIMKIYGVWNNKGGTGKTSIAFQVICRYAQKNPSKRVLAIDMCPQANLSELFLGGLQHGGSKNLLIQQGLTPRCSVGGYFQLRLPAPFAKPPFVAEDFLTQPSKYNSTIPKNLSLFCGDPLLELQANAINTLANTQIPGTNTWVSVIDWLRGAIQNAFSLVYGLKLPSAIYSQYAFATKLTAAGRTLPRVHLSAKNR